MIPHFFQIIAQIYGHVHTDTFRIYQNDNHTSTSVAFLAPSLTPRVNWMEGTNPGIRLYHYKLNKTHLDNYEQFYVDLAKGNDEKALKWTKLYDFKDAYGVPDLSDKSMIAAFNKIAMDEKHFQKSYTFNTLMKDNGM